MVAVLTTLIKVIISLQSEMQSVLFVQVDETCVRHREIVRDGVGLEQCGQFHDSSRVG